MTRRRRIVVQSVCIVLTVAAVFSFLVAPANTWIDQRELREELGSELGGLRESNRRLEVEMARLETTEEIERIAREDYNLVRPTDESYVVLLPPPTE